MGLKSLSLSCILLLRRNGPPPTLPLFATPRKTAIRMGKANGWGLSLIPGLLKRGQFPSIFSSIQDLSWRPVLDSQPVELYLSSDLHLTHSLDHQLIQDLSLFIIPAHQTDSHCFFAPEFTRTVSTITAIHQPHLCL